MHGVNVGCANELYNCLNTENEIVESSSYCLESLTAKKVSMIKSEEITEGGEIEIHVYLKEAV